MKNAISIMCSTSLTPFIFDQGRLRQMSRKWMQLCFWGLIIMTPNRTMAASFAPTDSQMSIISLPLIPHHELVRRRQRRGLVDVDEAALYQGYGTHYVDLYCGTSTPQHQTVSVDTGSGFTAFPCNGCNGCGSHLNPPYEPSKSNSFRKAGCNQCQAGSCNAANSGCQFGAAYQEGSEWTAYESTDQCFVGDSSTSSSLAFNLFFGCQTKATSFFVSQKENGIMGMGNSKTSFWYQMYKAGKLQQQMFSVCYFPSVNLSRDSNGADSGILTLGGSDARLHTIPIVYTFNATRADDSYFHVSIRNVYLRAGENVTVSSSRSFYYSDPTYAPSYETQTALIRLDLSDYSLNPSGGTVIDSGSTLTTLPAFWSAYFRQAWLAQVGTEFSSDIQVAVDKLGSLPTILFQFVGDDTGNAQQLLNSTSDVSTGFAAGLDSDHPNDVIVSFPPTRYMQYNYTVGKYQSALSFGGFYKTVLGANFIMGHDVLFDVTNNRLGWAESDCNYSGAVGNEGHALRTARSSGIPSLPQRATMAFIINHIFLFGVGIVFLRLL